MELWHEAKCLKDMDHKNVLSFEDSFIWRGNYYIVTEFAQKGDLKSFLASVKSRGDWISEKEILHIVYEIMEGLIYIHSLGKIHRDIKTANILIKSDSQVLIGDFGCSN